jgi:hypothetical protein
MGKDRFVKVDRLGRLVAPDREVERWLVKRAGKWRVIPAPRSLMIFERVEADEDKERSDKDAPPTEQVLFCGTVTARGQMTDVINMLHAGRWEGTFHVLTNDVRKTLMLKSGDIVGAVSTAKTDRLGELLCKSGIITSEQLEDAVKAAGGPQRLGAVLISKKLLTPHQLYAYLNQQVKEIFYSLLFLDEGEYYFKRRALDDPAWRQLRLNTSSVMLDGMRRVDEMQYFREKIPSSKVIFERGELKDLTLEETDHTLLDHIDGQKDLNQIARKVHLTEYDVTRVAYRLLQAGIIRPRAENFLGQKGQIAFEEGLEEVLRLANLVLHELLESAKEVGRERELRQAPTAFSSSNTSHARLFEMAALKPDGRLESRILLANLGRTTARNPTEFLYQGVNEFLSFAVFVVVDGLPGEKEQEIRQRLDTMLEESLG